ncbi:MAG: acylphosphatase [Candidatus Methanoperedens sp.]|nr:acylphosphatase [Candidatus Methanoperedens sp.]
MQKLKIRVTGTKLHDVGYRIPLINEALSLGINNFNTFNANLDGDQAVITILEADDEIIEEFKDFINTFHPENAVIEKVLFEEYKNNVPPIERVLQSFQMEQWGKGIPILLKISETLDNNTSILKEFKNETNDNFNDMKMIMSKHDADASERILSIKKEITGIKERLSNVEIAVSGL